MEVMATQGTLHLIIGPVGAGKSTFARRSAARQGGIFVDLDAWMVGLYGDDTRPSENVIAWYLERRERVRGLLWDTTLDILAAGTDVFLEFGLVSAAEREAFYAKARERELELTVYCLDAPREVRRERVTRRNASADGHTQVVPMEFFERASDAWEPPSDAERSAVDMVDGGP
jgi:predicted kinase